MESGRSLAQLLELTLFDSEGKPARLADLPGRYILLVLLRHLG